MTGCQGAASVVVIVINIIWLRTREPKWVIIIVSFGCVMSGPGNINLRLPTWSRGIWDLVGLSFGTRSREGRSAPRQSWRGVKEMVG